MLLAQKLPHIIVFNLPLYQCQAWKSLVQPPRYQHLRRAAPTQLVERNSHALQHSFQESASLVDTSLLCMNVAGDERIAWTITRGTKRDIVKADKLIRYSNNTSLLMSPRYSLQADRICTGLLRGDVRRHRRPTALRLHSALTPCAAAATAVAAQRQRGGWRPRRGSSTEQRSNGEMPRVNAMGKSTNGVPLLLLVRNFANT